MNKTSLALTLVALLAGCATTRTDKDVSPPLEYTDTAGKSHFVTGEIIKTYTTDELKMSKTWTHRLSVSIDGKESISGFLSAYSFNGTVSGEYDSKPAIASCIGTKKTDQWTDVRCDVAIDGKRIGALTF